MKIISEEDEKILERIKNEDDICGYVRVDKFELLVLSILFLILHIVTFIVDIIDKNTDISKVLLIIVFGTLTIKHIVELKKLKK